ncbi:MAG: recombination protein RecR [Candidatus Terrybacteria bacterium RIFCSPLOWO2_02_42_20]|uniref:Recombination protein RecR n=1 Tax=Candidatus Terrybacteria bacterium RIFCSPLOWO2_02_42_20 TaxID=1802370 RepID=A0A1G2PZ67_9BACT|nr:MAG: recombination protein RecR [Candidatus Terrybacteria bacterium RIFCSPLOWO2_02_42_20]
MDINRLIESFLKFPGIGPRQARRFVYFLAGENKEYADNLAKLILEVKSGMKQCESCYRYFESKNIEIDLCPVCSGASRDSSVIMVVEKDVDLENIERTGNFRGKYFVLGGLLSLAGNGIAEVRLKQLFDKVKKGKPAEIILATSATVEGENTNLYIERILEPLKVKITRLGRGLSTGAELEYSDSDTIENALKNRQ